MYGASVANSLGNTGTNLGDSLGNSAGSSQTLVYGALRAIMPVWPR